MVDSRLLVVHNVGAHLSGVESRPRPETAGMGSTATQEVHVNAAFCTPAAFLWLCSQEEEPDEPDESVNL